MNIIKNEPVLTAVVSLLTTALALLAAFGVHLTPEQSGAIVAFVVAALGVAYVVRQRVTPTSKA